ncbi:hypothetical protein RI367_008067 [Sorochytrium milnesiophthora]
MPDDRLSIDLLAVLFSINGASTLLAIGTATHIVYTRLRPGGEGLAYRLYATAVTTLLNLANCMVTAFFAVQQQQQQTGVSSSSWSSLAIASVVNSVLYWIAATLVAQMAVVRYCAVTAHPSRSGVVQDLVLLVNMVAFSAAVALLVYAVAGDMPWLVVYAQWLTLLHPAEMLVGGMLCFPYALYRARARFRVCAAATSTPPSIAVARTSTTQQPAVSPSLVWSHVEGGSPPPVRALPSSSGYEALPQDGPKLSLVLWVNVVGTSMILLLYAAAFAVLLIFAPTPGKTSAGMMCMWTALATACTAIEYMIAAISRMLVRRLRRQQLAQQQQQHQLQSQIQRQLQCFPPRQNSLVRPEQTVQHRRGRGRRRRRPVAPPPQQPLPIPPNSTLPRLPAPPPSAIPPRHPSRVPHTLPRPIALPRPSQHVYAPAIAAGQQPHRPSTGLTHLSQWALQQPVPAWTLPRATAPLRPNHYSAVQHPPPGVADQRLTTATHATVNF